MMVGSASLSSLACDKPWVVPSAVNLHLFNMMFCDLSLQSSQSNRLSIHPLSLLMCRGILEGLAPVAQGPHQVPVLQLLMEQWLQFPHQAPE